MNIDSVRDAFEIILCRPQKTCHVESLAGCMILSQKASQSNSPEARCYSGESTLCRFFQVIVNYRHTLKWPKLIRSNDRSLLPMDTSRAFYGQQHHLRNTDSLDANTGGGRVFSQTRIHTKTIYQRRG